MQPPRRPPLNFGGPGKGHQAQMWPTPERVRSSSAQISVQADGDGYGKEGCTLSSTGSDLWEVDCDQRDPPHIHESYSYTDKSESRKVTVTESMSQPWTVPLIQSMKARLQDLSEIVLELEQQYLCTHGLEYVAFTAELSSKESLTNPPPIRGTSTSTGIPNSAAASMRSDARRVYSDPDSGNPLVESRSTLMSPIKSGSDGSRLQPPPNPYRSPFRVSGGFEGAPSDRTSVSIQRFRLLPEIAQYTEEAVEHEDPTPGGPAFTLRFFSHAPSSAGASNQEKRSFRSLGERRDHLCRNAAVLHPASRLRMVWDAMAVLALTYDMITLPLTVFDMPQSALTFNMALALVLYWTCDFISSFYVGYHLADGKVELRWTKVVQHYLRTWCTMDATILALDWAAIWDGLFSGGASGGNGPAKGAAGIARVAKASRILRVLALIRLLRLRRLSRAKRALGNVIDTESTSICISICGNLAFIMLLTHLIATCWYWIGEKDAGNGWLAGRQSDYWFHNYLMSLEWSISNFTPGSSSVQAETTDEFGFHVVVLFFALVVFSVFVSSTTSLITKLMSLRASESQRLWRLKQFLQHHNFPLEFRDRLQRCVQEAQRSARLVMRQEDVELLDLLSKPLREEVQSFLHSKSLQVHPFLKLISLANVRLMRKLSTEAVEKQSFSAKDVIFMTGERIDKMSFVVWGKLGYERKGLKQAVEMGGSETLTKVVQRGNWFCEPALWTKWHGRGTMTAQEESELLELKGPEFRQLLISHNSAAWASYVRKYAEAIVEDLSGLAAADSLEASHVLDDVVDLTYEGDSVHKVMTEHRPGGSTPHAERPVALPGGSGRFESNHSSKLEKLEKIRSMI